MNQTAVLAGRHAVVTGSSSGIGKAIALAFAQAGASVLVHHRDSATAANDVREEIAALGRSCQIEQADFSVAGTVREFVPRVWNGYGAIDVWVNNAGADILTEPNSTLPFEDKLELLLAVDLRATIHLSRAVGRQMQSRGRGVIINIGWDQAETGMERDSGQLFGAAKSAIMGFSKSLAVDLAPQVRVNCIAPGWIRTSWGRQASETWQQRAKSEAPLGRWGEAEDVANLALFLAGESSAFITGQVLRVNGGAIR